MPLVELLEDHHRFASVLAGIRGCAHRRQVDGARAGLDWLEHALRAHIEFEEAELLPRFAELEHPIPNGAPAVFQRDHRLILEGFDALKQGWTDPLRRAELLGELAGVLEHHDLREARYFKPRLDEVLDPQLVESLLAEHAVAVQALSEPPEMGGRPVPIAEPDGLQPMERLRWRLAVGDGPGALAILRTIAVAPGSKAERHSQALEAALGGADWAQIWDRLRLLRAALLGQEGRR